MADLQKHLKDLLKKGMEVVGSSCKKGWYRVRNLRCEVLDLLWSFAQQKIQC
ncbi:unnamed protein product [Musa textilis]